MAFTEQAASAGANQLQQQREGQKKDGRGVQEEIRDSGLLGGEPEVDGQPGWRR